MIATAGIVLLALLLRLAVAHGALLIETDGTRLIEIARRLRASGRAFDPLFHPLYPALTALVQPAVGDWELSGRLVAVAAGTALLLPAYALAHDALDRRTALITITLLAVHPGLVRSAASVLADSTYAALVATGAWLAWRALARARRGLFVAAAAVLAVAYLARPEAAVYLAGLFVAGVVIARHRGALGSWMPSMAAALGTAVLIAGPYLVFLRRTLGHWTLSGKVQHNLVQDLGASVAGMPLAHPALLARHLAENAFLFQKYALPEILPGLLALFLVPGLLSRGRGDGWRAVDGTLLALAVPPFATLAFHVEGRIFFASLPFVLPFVARGLVATGTWLTGGAAAHRAALALTAVVAALLMPATLAPLARPDRGAVVYREAARFVAASRPADAVLLDRKPFVAFYSERRHAPLADIGPAELGQAARQSGARLVVLDSRTLGDRPRLLPLVWSAPPPEFEVVRDFDVAPADRVRLLALREGR